MKPRMLTSHEAIIENADKSEVCFVSMVDEKGMPYVVPMNFGLHNSEIYLHSAQTGRKIDILTTNPDVCVCFTSDHQLRWQNEEVACSYSMKYRSVRAYGKVEFITDDVLKKEALNIIMKKYTGKDYQYNEPSIREVSCWKIVVSHWEGRVYGF